MKNMWVGRRSGLIFDFDDDKNGLNTMEKCEFIFDFITHIGSSVLQKGDNLDVIVGQNVCFIFQLRLSGTYPDANFNIANNELNYVGRFHRINLFTTNIVDPNSVHVDLQTRWQRIKVKGL